MKTLSDFKEAAEFFKKNSIIPQRILKGNRKHKSAVRFGSDCWAIPTNHGYVIAVDSSSGGSAIKIVRSIKGKFKLTGSPYGGCTEWCGNSGLTRDEWSVKVLFAVNHSLLLGDNKSYSCTV